MKKYFKKSFCIFLCMLVAVSSWLGVAANAAAYPDGVTKEQTLNAIKGTDNLLKEVAPMLGGGTLKSMVGDMLYTDSALSDFLVSTYISFDENADQIKLIGLDCSPKALATALSKYTAVSAVLNKCDSWADVNLEGVSWGVSTKEGFADALSASFSPFNDILYCLLCDGDYEINALLTIDGDNGYENGIIPLLKAFKCNSILSQAQFTEQADINRNSMVKNIILPILTTIENAMESPANNLSDILPSVAYFIDNGELDKSINAILNPITSNKLISVMVSLDLFNLDSLTSIDINALMSSMASSEDGFKMKELDFGKLAACGTKTANGFVSNKSEAYVEILRWLIETLKLNKDNLGTLMSGENATVSMDTSFLTDILNKDTEDIVKFIILLFNPVEPEAAQLMVYPAFTPTTMVNTTALSEDDLNKVYNEIDDLLDQFVKEGGTHNNMGEVITESLYTNSNVGALVTGIYKALEDEKLVDVLKLLGIDVTPKGVGALLTEGAYKNAKNALSSKASWADVNLTNVSWGFKDGSRLGFQNAVTAVLRPFLPLLKVVLCEGDMTVMNSITIKGTDGYNTSVIPVLEALGCNDSAIVSYEVFKKDTNGDAMLRNILNPVFDLLNDISKKPVKTIVDKFPNIIYFIESGSLEKCISNLLLPVTSVFNRVPGVIELPVDTLSLTEGFDLDTLLGSMVSDLGISIAEFDIKTIASYGTSIEKVSKTVIDGKNVKYTYIEGNKTSIVLALLKVVAATLKMPGNENLLMSSMGGGTSSFDTSSMASQFASMTEDELVAWLYNLFFKERVTIEIVTGEDYKPTIIYTPKEKNNTLVYVALGYLGLCVVVGLILLINKKRLYGKAGDKKC